MFGEWQMTEQNIDYNDFDSFDSNAILSFKENVVKNNRLMKVLQRQWVWMIKDKRLCRK